jgi:uroporphyrinogen-III decarboxylase
MDARERFHATCDFEKIDRPMRKETIGFWNETLARWHGEGLPETVAEGIFTAPPYFGFDTMIWLPIAVNSTSDPGFMPTFDAAPIEETDTYVISRDPGGKVVKTLKDGRSTIPQYLDHPVKTLEDFEALKWRLDPETPGRFTDVLDIMITMAENTPDNYTCIVLCGLFGTYRNLMGLEGFSIAVKRDPALLHAIARQWVRMHTVLIKKLADRTRCDWIYFWEDMAYKNGPLISPKAFREFMTPYYREVIDHCRAETDIRRFGVDTDGNCWLLIPLFMEVGINILFPFEVQAGMDIREVRQKFPDLVIMGGIDKRVFYDGRSKDEMRKEIADKVPFMLKHGGYIPGFDHDVPPEVSLENFNFYLELVREGK